MIRCLKVFFTPNDDGSLEVSKFQGRLGPKNPHYFIKNAA